MAPDVLDGIMGLPRYCSQLISLGFGSSSLHITLRRACEEKKRMEDHHMRDLGTIAAKLHWAGHVKEDEPI